MENFDFYVLRFFIFHEDVQILEQADREGMEYLSLEVFKTPLDTSLSSLICCKQEPCLMTSRGPFWAKLLCDSTDVMDIHIFKCSALKKLDSD